MMDWFNAGFIAAIVAVSTGGWLVNNWIRARHGYPLENEWGGTTVPPNAGTNKELQRQNTALRDELKTVHDRVAVLERIVTDKGYGLGEQIEALRDRRRADAEDARVPVSLGAPERA